MQETGKVIEDIDDLQTGQQKKRATIWSAPNGEGERPDESGDRRTATHGPESAMQQGFDQDGCPVVLTVIPG